MAGCFNLLRRGLEKSTTALNGLLTSSLVETARWCICSKSSVLYELGAGFDFRTCGDTRRGETIRWKLRLRGELRTYDFLAGVGDPGKIADVLIEAFFLMDKGSIDVGTEIKLFKVVGFGVSVLPVGKKG